MQLELALAPAVSSKRSAGADRTWTLLDEDRGFARGLGTEAGVPVSPHLAENLSAVFACVNVIAQTLSVLPISVHRRDGDAVVEVDAGHPVARLFQRGPNENQTVVEFLEMMQAHCLLRGNAYAEIRYDDRGAPVELIPHHPDAVAVVRFPGTRRIAYDVTDFERGGTRRLLQWEMLHLRDRSDDGIIGKSRLTRAREAFGIAIASERFAAATFRNSARMSGVLSHPDSIGEEAAGNIRKSFEEIAKGSGKAGGIAVLEEGLKWTQISVSPADAETLASRKLSREMIGAMYRVPGPLLGDAQGTAYSSLIELNRMFAQHAILPWCRKWEATIAAALFSDEARRTYFVEFDLDELTRADQLTRWQSYRIAREIGGMNANEIRERERMNKRTDPSADDYFAPLNMATEQKGKPKD